MVLIEAEPESEKAKGTMSAVPIHLPEYQECVNVKHYCSDSAGATSSVRAAKEIAAFLVALFRLSVDDVGIGCIVFTCASSAKFLLVSPAAHLKRLAVACRRCRSRLISRIPPRCLLLEACDLLLAPCRDPIPPALLPDEMERGICTTTVICRFEGRAELKDAVVKIL